MTRPRPALLAFALFLTLPHTAPAAPETPSPYQLTDMPAGYHLQVCDDCGVPGRQPHVTAKDIYTFGEAQVQGDDKARTVAWGERKVEVDFDRLPPTAPYVLAVTYANESYGNRAQSIHAGDIQLQSAHELPKGKSERLLFRVPPEAIRDGKLHIEFRLEAQVNVVVSMVELWSTDPSPVALHLAGVNGLLTDLEGRVLNLAYDPQPNAKVDLALSGKPTTAAETRTDERGHFRFPRATFEKMDRTGVARLVASIEAAKAETAVPATELFFEPIRYRPLPTMVAGLSSPVQSLDGTWRISRDASDATRRSALSDKQWQDVRVPGQWLEQGFNIPERNPALMAREFTIPAEWASRRVILRFDAIHAGTQYWLNGKPLGSSEMLFTPVEWDITDLARFGQTNRLDLKMVVATASETLSSSSSYTGHSLGGIDRSVKIFALPPAHIATLHLDANLDDHYNNGLLDVDLGITNAEKDGISVRLALFDAAGKPVAHSQQRPIPASSGRVHVKAAVDRPLKWNAEQPNLYKLQIDLCDGDTLLERIERQVGFRKIELKDAQLYVNGAKVKLAGVARHEVDPLTGRADTARHAEEDVRLFKEANLNYLRTSHYPPTEELLAAADRLGMYVECEAPFCWVSPATDMANAKAIMTPTAARIDFCHTHPSVIIWSVANESHWSGAFDAANRLTKVLDPTRPTTFNHPFSKEALENCDIVNRHYLSMPFDKAIIDDTRPFLHGECFFELYHSRTDITINPGLRELWAAGNADPASEKSKAILDSILKSPGTQPGIHPGAWNHIVESKRLIGSVIWSGVDDVMFTRDGVKHSSEGGNAYWGLIDGWRRPKPEYWLAKLVFSPVHFPVRRIHWDGKSPSVRIPVENRYSFRNLSELTFEWERGEARGHSNVAVPPAGKGEIKIPLQPGTQDLTLKVSEASGTLINLAVIRLGTPAHTPLPTPNAGAPTVTETPDQFTIRGDHFTLVLDKRTGDFAAADPSHRSITTRFPHLHLTRFDFGDLVPSATPYATLPPENSRTVDRVSVEAKDGAATITIADHYADFTGQVTWRIDRRGTGEVSYDYTYTGAPDLSVREIGLQLAASRQADELRWNRFSEWGAFPPDHISRTSGSARARRDPKYGPTDAPEHTRPTWPWSLDQTDLGTNDFRSVKFNIRDASLLTPDGTGLSVHANQDLHIRASLSGNQVLLHLLHQCAGTPAVIKKGDRLTGHSVLGIRSR